LWLQREWLVARHFCVALWEFEHCSTVRRQEQGQGLCIGSVPIDDWSRSVVASCRRERRNLRNDRALRKWHLRGKRFRPGRIARDDSTALPLWDDLRSCRLGGMGGG